MTPGNLDRVNAPTLIGATAVAAHPPTKCCTRHKKKWPVHHGRDEALRIAAPSLTTSNRTTEISADGAVVAARDECATRGNDIREAAAANLDLQDSAIIAGGVVLLLEIVIVAEGQLRGGRGNGDGGRNQFRDADVVLTRGEGSVGRGIG